MRDPRIPLPVGTELSSRVGHFTITGAPIGYGGSSLLYPALRRVPAWTDLGTERCAVKECYPHPAVCGHAFTRRDGVVEPEDRADEAAWTFLVGQRRQLRRELLMYRNLNTHWAGDRIVPFLGVVSDWTEEGEPRSPDFSFCALRRVDEDGWFLPELLSECARPPAEGGPLRTGGLPAIGTSIRILLEVLEALAAVHQAGCIHGDIQPGNLFLTNPGTGEVGRGYLLDFSCSRYLREDGRTEEIADQLVFSTPGFTAPEIQWGNDGSLRLTKGADIYSVGRLFLYLLTGNTYWEEGRDRVPLEGAALTQLLPADGARVGCGPELLAEVNEILARALALEPSERYPDARDMLARVERLAERAGLQREKSPALDFPVDMVHRKSYYDMAHMWDIMGDHEGAEQLRAMGDRKREPPAPAAGRSDEETEELIRTLAPFLKDRKK